MDQRVVVVGGGIAGLVAARELAAAGRTVLLLEGSPTVGGKLRRGEVAGITLDVGAEAIVNRRPEGVALARELGIGLVRPSAATSRIWTRGALRPLPRTLMGAPLDLAQLADSGVLGDEGLRAARREPELAATTLTEAETDLSVGDLVDRRYGPEVTDRLVEPLLGGVYAGRAREISVRAAIPSLLDLAERGSITAQAGGVPPSAAGSIFTGIPGGMWRLPVELGRALVATGRVEIRTGAMATGLRRTADGFEVTVRTAGDERLETADEVVLATPAAPTARLLATVAPAASGELARVEYASTAVVTFAFHADDPGVRAALDVGASGFLVPPVDGRRIKAATFSFAKWDWVRAGGATPEGDLLVLRTSVGRIGEEETLQVPDEELVAASLADLAEATGLSAEPVDARVQRWGGGLPQYAVGHLDRVARIRAGVAAVPGLAVCGAAYDGVGIPAVIASAQRAAAELVAGSCAGDTGDSPEG
ncbi:protoporphyrinogen oxidase [Nocardioides sp. GY 10113]|uniref:protoporphyrinogen oxidase n=1 Tax=Nocardioides sp. GY 10113 TaxID=2569761 RepID=UPI001980475B|nr:protoporphyrinogen oxidase [Nocardioides sp. GY 10113]